MHVNTRYTQKNQQTHLLKNSLFSPHSIRRWRVLPTGGKAAALCWKISAVVADEKLWRIFVLWLYTLEIFVFVFVFFSFRFDVARLPDSSARMQQHQRADKRKMRETEKKGWPQVGTGPVPCPTRPGPARSGSRHPMGTPRYTYGWFYAPIFGLFLFLFLFFFSSQNFLWVPFFNFFSFVGFFFPSHFDIFKRPPFYLA
jgi:hypothetical protein